LDALRLYDLPEDTPAILYGCPALPAGTRTLAVETTWDLPSLAPSGTALIDVTVPGVQQGDHASAALVSSTRFVELDAVAWTNNTVRVKARNISGTTFDLAAATVAWRSRRGEFPEAGFRPTLGGGVSYSTRAPEARMTGARSACCSAR
jgi:hypothetical protein